MAISTGQRAAFGRRYGTGGMGVERTRLGNEYTAAPNRNAMGMQLQQQADQFAQGMAQSQSNYERSFNQQQDNFAKQMAGAGGMSGPDYSGLPGPGGYLARYPDVANSLYYSKDPYAHYLQHGKGMGYTWVGDPTPEWSLAEQKAFYAYMYPDVKNSGMDPAHHYNLYGQKEGRFWPWRTQPTTATTTPPVTQGGTLLANGDIRTSDGQIFPNPLNKPLNEPVY